LDSILEHIVGFVQDVDFASLAAPEVAATVRRNLDTVACAAGGYSSDVGAIARKLATTAPSNVGASVFGLPGRTSLEYATFANGLMMRYLDMNDCYFGVGYDTGFGAGAGHPSDTIPGLMAVGEAAGASGRQLITAIYVAYEVFEALADAVRWFTLGWDYGALCAVASAAGAGKLLELDAQQTRHAIAIAVTPSMPLLVTRIGTLSHWKGCAGAHACMNGVFAARLAHLGLSGPAEPFEGPQALCERVTGPFTLNQLGSPRYGLRGIERSWLKTFPVVAHALGPVELALDLRDRCPIEDVEAITIATYEAAWFHAGGGGGDQAEKWDPQTRETADHSIPYATAVALRDGAVNAESFATTRVLDPTLRPLMTRISVVVDQTLASRPPHEEPRLPATMDIRLRSGEVLRGFIEYPRGAPRNPTTDDELSAKFHAMTANVLDHEPAARLLEELWKLEELTNLDDLSTCFRQFRAV
jgi:2-methylcitrate dehydratase